MVNKMKKGIFLLIGIFLLSTLAFADETLTIGPSPIEFDTIKLIINGDSAYCDETNNNDCDDEFEEIPLDADLELEIILENTANIDIDDVEVRVTSSNRDIDFDDSRINQDIDEDDEETYEFELELDNRIEDSDDSNIEVEVKFDYNNITYTLNYDFDIEFQVDDYSLEVSSRINSPIYFNNTGNICYSIYNDGLKDQDNIKVTIDGQVFKSYLLEYEEGVNDCYQFTAKNLGNTTIRLEVFYYTAKNKYSSVFMNETYETYQNTAPKIVVPEEPNETEPHIVIESAPAVITYATVRDSDLDTENNKFLNIIAGTLLGIVLVLTIILFIKKNGKKK